MHSFINIMFFCEFLYSKVFTNTCDGLVSFQKNAYECIHYEILVLRFSVVANFFSLYTLYRIMLDMMDDLKRGQYSSNKKPYWKNSSTCYHFVVTRISRGFVFVLTQTLDLLIFSKMIRFPPTTMIMHATIQVGHAFRRNKKRYI